MIIAAAVFVLSCAAVTLLTAARVLLAEYRKGPRC